MGIIGNFYDSALAETVNGLYRSEIIHYLKKIRNGINDIELGTLEWIDLIKSVCIARLVMFHLLSLKNSIMTI